MSVPLSPVSPDQRFTRANPCPVCGGGQDDERGSGRRCFGFLSRSGRTVHCSRKEHAGALKRGATTGTYRHSRFGACPCGHRHDAPATSSRTKVRRVSAATPVTPRGPVTKYDILDRQGNVVACHARRNLPNGGKRLWWEQPDGTAGLGERKLKNLPLYGLPNLLAAPEGSRVVVCEGEKAAEALLSRGILAVGTVTGANTIPSGKVLFPLLDYQVILWPDNDEVGRQHMDSMASALRRLSDDDTSSIHLIDWAGAPDKADAHDFFDLAGDGPELDSFIAAAAIDDQVVIGGQHIRLAIYEEIGHLCHDAVLIRLADVVKETVRWLWRNRIPLGKLSLIEGDPGLGKSILALLIAACVTKGEPMPDGSTGDLVGPAAVVLLSAEDGLADTIKPRLEAAGADPDLVIALDAVRTADGTRLPNLTDLDEIRAAITEARAKLVIIDPLMAYLPSEIDSHRDQDARRILAPLTRLAEETGAAIVVVRHLNKNTAVSAMYRGGGSIGIIGAVRSAMIVAKDPDDVTGHRRVIAMQKQNLAAPSPSVAFRVVANDDNVPHVVWEGESHHDAASLLASGRREKGDGKLSQAEAFLEDTLARGPMTAKKIIALASANTVSEATLRRAKRSLGVRSEHQGFGPGSEVAWSLPGAIGNDVDESIPAELDCEDTETEIT